MKSNPEKLSTNSRPESEDSGVLPAWLIDGWKMTAGSISPDELAELDMAIKLINEARQQRGLLVTLDDLGVHFSVEGLSDEAADLDPTPPQPVFGTIEDKTVENGSVLADAAALGVNGLAQANQRLQLPPATGVIS